MAAELTRKGGFLLLQRFLFLFSAVVFWSVVYFRASTEWVPEFRMIQALENQVLAFVFHRS